MRITPPLAATALAAALAGLAPARALAGAWQLRAGAEYGQSDVWAVNGPKTTTPRLDVDLGLSAGGELLGRGVLDWAADAQYDRGAIDGNAAVQDRLSYGLRSSLFGGTAGPLTLTAHARRDDQSFSTEGVAAGSVLTTSYGGDFHLRANGARPWLRGSYGWSQSDSDTRALGRTERTAQTLGASTGFGSAAFSYNAAYQGNLSEGSFQTERYQDHQVEVGADASLAANTKLRLGNFYYVRSTPLLTAINARQEAQGVTATLQHTSDGGFFQLGGYTYGRAMQQTLTGTVERLQHRASYRLGGPIASEWSLGGNLDTSVNEDRRPTGTDRSTGQALGATVTWRRAREASTTTLNAGPTVGLQEPERGDTRVGWGVSAGALHQRNATVQTSVGYDVGFSENIGPDEGWAFRQSLTGTAAMRVGLASLSASLQAGADRRETLGQPTAASRSVTGLGTWRLRATDVTLQVGYQDGTSGRIPTGTIGDGLFIAPAYDSRTAYTSLSAGTTLGRLVTRLRARWSTVDLPDRPAYDETQLSASLGWAYGALRISVEDSYVITEVEGGRYRINQLMVKAYRVFGSRF